MKIPGFVDLQVNGYKGVNFSGGGLTEDRFVEACRGTIAAGTTAFLPTVITTAEETYRRNLPLIARSMRRAEFQGRLLGIHLEGPFISTDPGAAGTHPRQWIRPPDPDFLDRLLEWADGKVKMLTLAAELPGADEVARRAVEKGVVVSLGHQMAGEEDLERLVRAGATALTHLGNGAPAMLPRHRNPIWAGLANDALAALIITDGHHLPASVVKVMLRAKGSERCVVVSDASPLAGCPPGRYRLFESDAAVEPNGLAWNPATGYLVGSTATMPACMKHLASLGLLSAEEVARVGWDNPLRLIHVDPGSVAREK